MGRKKGSLNKKGKKDKFDTLGDDFKDAVNSSSADEIRKRIGEVALLDCTMKATLKADPDVSQAKDALKNLMEPYREDLRSYKLQIEYCKDALEGAGTALPKSGVVVLTAKEAKALEGILDPDGTGRTTVSHKPIGESESVVLRKGTD